MTHSRNANVEPIRSAVDRVLEEVLGKNPICPVCRLRVKSPRHFDQRAYKTGSDGKEYDAHVGLKFLFFEQKASDDSLKALKARYTR